MQQRRFDPSRARPIERTIGESGPSARACFYPGVAATHIGAAWNPGSLVSARITPLRLEAFEQLPKHARRCVFWEVDPSTLGPTITCRPGIREGSLAVDGDAGVGVVRSDGRAVPRRRRRPADADRRRCHSARRQPVPGLRVLRTAGRRAARAALPQRAGQRRRRTAHLARCGVRPRCRAGCHAQPDRVGGRRSGAPRRAGTGSVRAHRRGDRAAGPAAGVARTAARRGGARGLLGRPVRPRRRLPCRTSGSSSSRSTATSRGFGSSSSRGWAGRPMSRRRWSGCWKPRSSQPVGASEPVRGAGSSGDIAWVSSECTRGIADGIRSG